MRKVAFHGARIPGDFYWHEAPSGERRLYVMLPSQGGGWVHSPATTNGWDGDEERPTMKDLIEAEYGNGRWRGFIRNGFLIPA